ncbi:MAG TPA: potassium-transporting ATPase subunit B, partial [Chloroflexota bacterium]|nr:potassium-transporting ATPase subunit B [Chloroflexota bacterium]
MSITQDQQPAPLPPHLGGERRQARRLSIFDPNILKQALIDSFLKLNPRTQLKNPVMFTVGVGAAITTVEFLRSIFDPHAGLGADRFFTAAVGLWLWFTVLFANFAEAMAEGRGKAQADTLRRTRTDARAKKLLPDGQTQIVSATELRRGDIVLVVAGDLIPGDGDVLEGVASVNEAAITGESAPVIKEPGTDIRSSVTGGTTIVSDSLKIRITANPGETFIDRMI